MNHAYLSMTMASERATVMIGCNSIQPHTVNVIRLAVLVMRRKFYTR